MTNDHYFTDEYRVDDDGTEYGMTKDDLGKAISVWVVCRRRGDLATVERVAAIFNVSEALVREVVDAHPWMFTHGEEIDVDGA